MLQKRSVRNRRFHLNYLLVTIILILLITTIIVSVLFGIEIYRKYFHAKPEICTTKACLSAANMIMQNMDTSEDPCEDFFRFSCGNFIKNHRIPDDKSRLDIFDDLQNKKSFGLEELLSEPISNNDIDCIVKTKKLFKSCKNETFMEKSSDAQLIKMIKTMFGNWPILESTWTDTDYDPMETLIQLRLLQIEPIIDVNLGFNPNNPRSIVLKACQPDMILLAKLFFQDVSLETPYRNLIFQFVEYLNTSNTNKSDLTEQVDGIINTEKMFANLSIDEEEKRNQTFTNMTIKELSEKVPLFDWKRFILKGIFGNLEHLNVTENEIILVQNINYLISASYIIKEYTETHIRDLKNTLVWSFVKDKSQSLSKKFKDARLEYDKIYKGTISIQSRSLFCVSVVLQTMDYAVGRLYVAKYFHKETRDNALTMIDFIQEEFKHRIRNADWMDNFSKIQALNKADSMDRKIGYPDFIFNDTYMNEMYEDFNFTEDDFLTNNLILIKVAVQNDLKSFRKERNRTNWISAPAAINAFYSPELNQICFPAGILQPPFYYYNSPNYLNFGGIGNVISHEIIHGFDDRGRLYDKDGVFYPDSSSGLWSNETIQKYKKKVQCIIDQYNRYNIPHINKNLNGFQTQGENIADNGGIKQSFYAYKRWLAKNKPEPLLPGLDFNQDQLFFISYGQIWCSKYRDQAIISAITNEMHPISEFRLLGSTSNFDEFAKAFQCKPSTKNNPETKCDVW